MIDIDGPVWIPVAPPGLAEFLAFSPQPVPALPVFAGVLAVAYIAGVIRMRALRRRWPLRRTLLFLSGCALLAATSGLGVEGYGLVMFSVFMFQQLTLMITIPPLLVLGAPGTLLLRATPHHGIGRGVLRAAHAALRSRAMGIALHPVVAIGLFILAFYGLYLGGFADALLSTWAGHLALEFAFLASGILFAMPVLSPDPLPVRQGYMGRVLDVFIEMALHAFFGVIIMTATTPLIGAFSDPPSAWGLDPLADQQIAGGLAWSYGEAPTVLLLLYLLHRWYRDDTRRAIRADRRAESEGDPDLDAYNRYLERLRTQNGEK
ncbi:MAG: cytochrome c oxidase assembly protein [Rhodoglobus sp.]